MSLEYIGNRFLIKIKCQIYSPIRCSVKITPIVVKLKIYFPNSEPYDDDDLRFLNAIIKEATDKHFQELADLDFDKRFMFIFHGSKITVKWFNKNHIKYD